MLTAISVTFSRQDFDIGIPEPRLFALAWRGFARLSSLGFHPHSEDFAVAVFAEQEQGLIQDAMQCYQTAIKLRPDFAIAYGNLASCYYDTG